MRPQWAPCSSATDRVILEHLKVGVPSPDFLELRVDGVPVSHVGWRCRNAADWQACEHAYVTTPLPVPTPWSSSVGEGSRHPTLHLVFERDGHFAVAASEQEVLALLTPLDSAVEAILLARFRGYTLPCENEAYSFPATNLPDGWTITVADAPASGDPAAAKRYTLHVSKAGELRVIDSAPLRKW